MTRRILSNNFLTGPIPDMSALTNLQTLYVALSLSPPSDAPLSLSLSLTLLTNPET